jgi:serine/threonine-protein kinase
MSEPTETPKSWRTRWIEALPFGKGGQSHTYSVRERSNPKTPPRFLKVLKDQQRTDLRKRFRREVAAYETLTHRAIPKLLDTNASGFDDPDVELYLVTELVEGPTLDQWIKERGKQTIEVATQIVEQLLDVVD